MASSYSTALVPKTAIKAIGTSASAIYTTTTPVLCYTFSVQAKVGNTGTIYVGTSAVDATAAISLAAGTRWDAPILYSGGTNPKQYDLTQWYVRGSAATLKAAIVQVVEERQLS